MEVPAAQVCKQNAVVSRLVWPENCWCNDEPRAQKSQHGSSFVLPNSSHILQTPFQSSAFFSSSFKSKQPSKPCVHTTFPAAGIPADTPQLIVPASPLSYICRAQHWTHCSFAPGLHIQFVLLPQFCHLDIGFTVLFHPGASLPGVKFSDHLEQEVRWGREPGVRTTLSSCSISLLCTGQKAHALHRQQSWEMLLWPLLTMMELYRIWTWEAPWEGKSLSSKTNKMFKVLIIRTQTIFLSKDYFPVKTGD